MRLSKFRGLGLIAVYGLFVSAFAIGGECEPAVDMIDSNDAVNRIADCDYRDEGLNGWLANLGSGKDEPKPKSSVTKQENAAIPTSRSTAEGFVLRTQPAADALSLLQQRFGVIQQAAERCAPGVAEVSRQAYQMDERGNTTLLLEFYCHS